MDDESQLSALSDLANSDRGLPSVFARQAIKMLKGYSGVKPLTGKQLAILQAELSAAVECDVTGYHLGFNY